MTAAERIAHARAILENPLFHEIMAGMEAGAIDACLYAQANDHETRASAANKARAIRDLRAALDAILREANPTRKGAPA